MPRLSPRDGFASASAVGCLLQLGSPTATSLAPPAWLLLDDVSPPAIHLPVACTPAISALARASILTVTGAGVSLGGRKELNRQWGSTAPVLPTVREDTNLCRCQPQVNPRPLVPFHFLHIFLLNSPFFSSVDLRLCHDLYFIHDDLASSRRGPPCIVLLRPLLLRRDG
jgi:hypothetical protein